VSVTVHAYVNGAHARIAWAFLVGVRGRIDEAGDINARIRSVYAPWRIDKAHAILAWVDPVNGSPCWRVDIATFSRHYACQRSMASMRLNPVW